MSLDTLYNYYDVIEELKRELLNVNAAIADFERIESKIAVHRRKSERSGTTTREAP